MAKSKTKPKQPDDAEEDEGEDTADIIDVGNLLSKFGFSKSDVKRVRLGRGLIGKLTSSLMVTLAALAAIGVALAAHTGIGYVSAALAVASLVVFVYCRYIANVRDIAKEQPLLSLLEGTELIAYQKMQLDYAAKELSAIPQKVKTKTDPAYPGLEPPTTAEE